MTLPAHPIHIPAGLPIDESTRLELLDAGKANRSNVNVRHTDRGALKKRLGYVDAIGISRFNGGLRTTGNRLFSHLGAVCTIDGTHLDVYSPSANRSYVAGRVPEASSSVHPCPTPGRTNTFEDVAYVNGFLCGVQLTQGTTRLDASAVILDAETFAVVSPLATLETDITDACVATYGKYVFLIAADASTGAIYSWHIDTTSDVTIATGWLPSGDVSVGDDYAQSLAVQSLDDKIAFAYASTASTTVRVSTLNVAGFLQTTGITASVDPVHVDVAGSSADTLWVAWTETTAVKVQGLDPNDLTITLATPAPILTLTSAGSITIVPTTAGSGRVFSNEGDNPYWRSMKVASFLTDAGTTTSSGVMSTVPNTRFVSRGFYSAGRVYVHVVASDYATENNAIQTQVVLVDATDEAPFVRPIACPTFNSSVPASYFTSYFTSVRSTAGTKPNVPTGVRSTTRYFPLGIRRGGDANAAAVIAYDFADRARWHAVEHQNSTFLSGGLLSVLDGSRVTEAGFLFRPPRARVTETGTGPTTSIGWRYVSVYEDMDAAGNWNQSGVSDPVLKSAFTNKSIVVETQALAVTSRLGNTSSVRLAIYRTIDGGEPPYYLVATIANDTALAYLAYTDSTTDADLVGKPLLYGSGNLPATNGSGQDRRAPSGLSYIISYNEMLVGAAGSTLFYSGGAVDGEGTWFSPVFSVHVPGSDDITGLVDQDGTLYIFKAGSISATAGESPSDNGASGGLGGIRQLAVDVGCIEPASIVATSAGIFFQSTRGIELLLRSGSVVWIGEGIRSTLARFPVVSSAVLDNVHGLVRFSLAEVDGGGRVNGDGRDLVFDLTASAWSSVDDKRGNVAHEATQDAAMLTVDGVSRYAWLGVDGDVWNEKLDTDLDKCVDGTHYVVSQYETPPIKLGLQQEQRVYEMELLFERHEAAGITIEFANDYGGYGDVTDDKVWTEAATLDQRQISFRPKPRGESVQLRIRDTEPAVFQTGEGFTFVGLSADIAPKQGPTRGTPRLAAAVRR